MSNSPRNSPAIDAALARAKGLAIERNSAEIDTAHLFLGLLEMEIEQPSQLTPLLQMSGVTFEEAQLYASSACPTASGPPEQTLRYSSAARRMISMMEKEAYRCGSMLIHPEHLLIAAVRFQRRRHVGEVLRPLGLDAAILSSAVAKQNASTQFKKGGNPLESLTESSREAIESAHAIMRGSFCGRISTVHLLLGVLADPDNVAAETLRLANIDLESFTRAADALLVNDGEIATPQKKFSPSAKRALERAKREAAQCGNSLIGPQHLLFGLLPKEASISEKVSFGTAVTDPLDRFWPQWDTAAITAQYCQIWRRSQTVEKPPKAPTPHPPNWVIFEWYWGLGGFIWGTLTVTAWFLQFPGLLIWAFCTGILLAFGGAILGELKKDYKLRDQLASFWVGILASVLIVSFLFVSAQ
ncbi:hypothetical protein EON80_12575 [bacterium]|nr:MAG: hypothetical protein EON80_12575 [bacterium]